MEKVWRNVVKNSLLDGWTDGCLHFRDSGGAEHACLGVSIRVQPVHGR